MPASRDDGPKRPGILLVQELGRLVREKRDEQRQSVRQAAAEADISFTTLSRVEGGGHPDLATFLKLCAWLGLSPEHFYSPVPQTRRRPLDEAISHLQTDPALSPDATETIAKVLKDMYKALAKKIEAPATFLGHLRAAPVMRPGVPERLNHMLKEMKDNLERKVHSGEV